MQSYQSSSCIQLSKRINYLISQYNCCNNRIIISASEDLDFDDPPPFLKSLIEQVFWCLSARVRQIIRDKYPRRVFFCFYRGVCTWACEDNPATAKERIK